MKKIIGLDLTYTREYKNAELEIVCEDDTLTIARAYVDNDCIAYMELGNDKYPDGLPNNPKYINAVYDLLKTEVDKNIESDLLALAK